MTFSFVHCPQNRPTWNGRGTSSVIIQCAALEIVGEKNGYSGPVNIEYLRLSQGMMSLWLRRRIPASLTSLMRRAGAAGGEHECRIQRCTMAFILMGIACILLLAFLVRFFQAVHRWDEEICSMEIRGSVRAGRVPKQEAA